VTQRIAVLMTTHNRARTSVRCLESLRVQNPGPWTLHTYLVDDRSSDNTTEAVKSIDLPVTVIQGPGDLYWAGGMAVAERAAMLDKPDALLWLNDDVVLDSDAIQRLVALQRTFKNAIVIGATRSARSGRMTYGGRNRTSAWHPQRFALLGFSSEVQHADTFNGNVVLIPRCVREKVGPIDGRFPHAYADDDYGLRARALGIEILQAPGSVGECERDHERRSPRGPTSWGAAQSIKGTRLSAQIRYFRRHGGRVWPLLLFGQQVRQLVPSGTGPGALQDVSEAGGVEEA